MKFIPAILILCVTLIGGSVNKPVPIIEIRQFRNGGTNLEGTLHLPGNTGRYPLAIFIHGSGRATRNDYEEFLEPLIEEGIAVFRYDKRGVAASGGTYIDVNTENSERTFRLLASDAFAAIRYLTSDHRIDSNKVILIGGSQAGWIIPEINTLTDIWLSVCISGPLVSVGEEIFYSDLAERGAYSQFQADQMLKDFSGLKGYDPITSIGKMKNPSLWIFGGKDVSIPVERSMHLVDSIKHSSKIPLDIKFYPEADHGLFHAGKREDYLSYILQWITKQR